MDDMELERMRYPVGRLETQPALTPAERVRCIDRIEALPAKLRASVAHLGDAQLDTPYRPDGWTIRQVVHHLPDSHLNAYVRFRLGATEHEPRITTYEQALWAKEADSALPVDVSLRLLEALHERWVMWLRTQDDGLWERKIDHPDMGLITLDELLQVYCWHSRHHMAHVDELKAREGWT